MSLIYFLGQFLHPFSDVKLIWLGESTIYLILLYKGNALVYSPWEVFIFTMNTYVYV